MKPLVLVLSLLSWPTLASAQIIPCSSNNNMSATTVQYNRLLGMGGWNATELNRQTLGGPSGTLKNWRVTISADPDNGAGVDSYTLVIMVAGSPSALSIAIVDGQTSGTDSDEVAYTAGQQLEVRSTPANTPAAARITDCSVEFVPTTRGQTLWGSSSGSTALATSGAQYIHAINGSGYSLTQTDYVSVIPTAGTLSGLQARIGTALSSGSFTITAQTGATHGALADSALTCQITSQTCADTTNSVAVSAGDVVVISITASTPSAGSVLLCGMIFTPNVDGEYVWATSDLTALSATVNNFHGMVDTQAWNATEATQQQGTQGVILKAIYAVLNADPDNGAGTDSYLLGARQGGSTVLSCTIADGATTCNATGEVAFSAGNLIGTISTPTNTPTATRGEISYLMFQTPRRVVLFN